MLSPETVERARAWLEGAGFRTVVGRHALDARGYLAGNDADRAADLMDAFTNPHVQGIVCIGGGYGALRILRLLDYGAIASHPKVFVGYSDITALHVAIGKLAGLVTFHGALARDFAVQRPSTGETSGQGERHGLGETPHPGAIQDAGVAFTWSAFLRAVTRPEPLGRLVNPAGGPALETLHPGRATGLLVGGNLSLLVSTLGTPYEIDTRGRILLLEDVGEAPYRLDRMLTHLALAGKLDEAAGFVVAECVDCLPPEPERPTLTVREVLDDILLPRGKPAVYGLAAGHGPARLTLPLGVPVTVDGDCPAVVVEAAGVEGETP
ncbi:MAG: LD-carboxypeptidase [Limnochordaceae bacterium]|nr:LD-carboxypeptidase [Limnochordaceae bacterium]